MNLPFFIARRYLFSGKSRNVVNIISAITVAGIALASMAMICTLSVFNGFRGLMESLFTSFDPDFKIVASRGKVFNPETVADGNIAQLGYVDAVTYSLEEQALAQYNGSQRIVTVKGAEDNFMDVCDIEDILYGSGKPVLKDQVCDFGIMGVGLMHALDCGIQPVQPVCLYAPKRGERINLTNPAANFTTQSFFSPGVVFQVSQPKYDDNYVIVPMSLARQLFGYSTGVSSIDIRIRKDYSQKKAYRNLKSLAGPGFEVLDRYGQQADVFRVIKLEKLISYLFLSFILFIACFNIVGSLVMLMLEKREDSVTLSNIGLADKSIRGIFILDGLLISVLGAMIGLSIGVALVLLQQRFGFIPLGQNGGFVVDSYPVRLRIGDVAAVLFTVAAVTLIVVVPVRRFAARIISR